MSSEIIFGKLVSGMIQLICGAFDSFAPHSLVQMGCRFVSVAFMALHSVKRLGRRPIRTPCHSLLGDRIYACKRIRQWAACTWMRWETAVGNLAEPHGFDTTHWSLILSAAGSNADEQKTQEALAELCRTDRRPAFVFVSRQGYTVEEDRISPRIFSP